MPGGIITFLPYVAFSFGTGIKSRDMPTVSKVLVDHFCNGPVFLVFFLQPPTFLQSVRMVQIILHRAVRMRARFVKKSCEASYSLSRGKVFSGLIVNDRALDRLSRFRSLPLTHVYLKGLN